MDKRKILIVSTYDSKYGAGIAAQNLHNEFRRRNLISNMLVLHKLGSSKNVSKLNLPFFFEKLKKFLWGLDRILLKFFKNSSISWSFGFVGFDITKDKLFREADIIIICWIQGGFISIKNLNRIFNSNKKIVWRFSDMWPLTAGCHYSLGCEKFKLECKNCHLVRNDYLNIIVNRVYKYKKNKLSDKKFKIMTPSNWLNNQVKKSVYYKNIETINIGTFTNNEIFKYNDNNNLMTKIGIQPNKFIILVGSVDLNDSRKGFEYALKALGSLRCDFIVLTYGKVYNVKLKNISFINLGYIEKKERLSEIYNISDVFLAPYLYDNLPNTIIESLSCGTPVVAFDTCGIPELITHRNNGYLAKSFEVDSLVDGLMWAKKFVKPKVSLLPKNFTKDIVMDRIISFI